MDKWLASQYLTFTKSPLKYLRKNIAVITVSVTAATFLFNLLNNMISSAMFNRYYSFFGIDAYMLDYGRGNTVTVYIVAFVSVLLSVLINLLVLRWLNRQTKLANFVGAVMIVLGLIALIWFSLNEPSIKTQTVSSSYKSIELCALTNLYAVIIPLFLLHIVSAETIIKEENNEEKEIIENIQENRVPNLDDINEIIKNIVTKPVFINNEIIQSAYKKYKEGEVELEELFEEIEKQVSIIEKKSNRKLGAIRTFLVILLLGVLTFIFYQNVRIANVYAEKTKNFQIVELDAQYAILAENDECYFVVSCIEGNNTITLNTFESMYLPKKETFTRLKSYEIVRVNKAVLN